MLRPFLSGCLFVAVCLSLCGCGRSGRPAEKTYPVSGTVTLDGKPLADGEIYFITQKEGTLEALPPIKDGKFKGNAQAGNRRVEIRAFRKTESRETMPGTPPEPGRENYIPAQYNTDSTLSANVTPEGPNEFDFQLKSK